MSSTLTAIIASLAMFISFMQETAKNTAPSAPMRPEFIAVAAAPMQFKGCMDFQRMFSAETVDAGSIVAELCHLVTLSSEEHDAAKFASLIDRFLLKGPQYIAFGLSINEEKPEQPEFYIAVQFRDDIPSELVTELYDSQKEFSFIPFSKNVVVAIPRDNINPSFRHFAPFIEKYKNINQSIRHFAPFIQNNSNSTITSDIIIKETESIIEKTGWQQTSVLPDKAFLRFTADISNVEAPEDALRELADTPFPEFASARFAAITFADNLTFEARFTDVSGAKRASKIISNAKKFLLKEFAGYPIYNAEIKKIKVTQSPVSNEDGRGSFTVLATIPYDALTAFSSALSKKNEAILEAIFGKETFQRMSNDRNDKASAIQCTSNLKQLMLAVIMYSMDNDDILPAAANWQKLLKEYVGNEKVMVCPATQTPYIYVLNGQSLDKLKQPSKTIAFYEDFGNHTDAINIAFVDGHVEKAKLDGATTIEELAAAKGFILVK